MLQGLGFRFFLIVSECRVWRLLQNEVSVHAALSMEDAQESKKMDLHQKIWDKVQTKAKGLGLRQLSSGLYLDEPSFGLCRQLAGTG